MRVTVCEMSDDRAAFAREWAALGEHVRAQGSDLVLLPEMIFSAWFARTPDFDPAVWAQSLAEHDAGIARLGELGARVVVSTRPVERSYTSVVSDLPRTASYRHNEGFVWDNGYTPVHLKAYLPDEDGFYEAHWYARGRPRAEVVGAGGALLAFAICSELWFFDEIMQAGRGGAQIVACPRATERASLDKWIVGGQAAAIVAGAFCLSSNRVSADGQFGGQGWIIDPDGALLAVTSAGAPFVTLDIDLEQADAAKRTYPRYITRWNEQQQG